MKVRWTRDSLRLRITPTELEALQRGEPVHEGLGFPGGGFWNMAIRIGQGGETTLASDEQGGNLFLSPSDRDTLAQPDIEGVYFQWPTPTPLRFSIEKDFPCLHPRASEALEPPGETFAAPEGFEQRKREG